MDLVYTYTHTHTHTHTPLEAVEIFELNLGKLATFTTDGTASMIGHQRGFVVLLMKHR